MRYRLTGGLEAGALAELFTATGDDRFPVTMKLFFPHTSDRGYAREIIRIAQRVNALETPGLVRTFEVGTVRDRLAVVREQVRGATVAQLLERLERREAFVSPSLCFSLLADWLGLLERAHGGGVVHGGLTPGNLLLGHSGAAQVCDFGVLQALRSSAKLARLFSSGGRSVYRAPEVLHGEPPTPASDVYSLAAVAYQLLTLREPRLEGMDLRRGTVPPPSRVDRRISPRVDALLGRALEGSPSRRYARCSEFAEALREFMALNGGTVSLDERQRLAGSVEPGEGSGPVPFAEPFALSETAVLHIPDEEMAARTAPLVDSSLKLGGAAAARHRDGLPYDDDTDPEPTAATEAAWDAPPGLVSGLRRRLLGQATSSRPARVRWVQDFSVPLPEESAASSSGAPARSSSGPAAVIPVRFPRRVSDTLVEAPRSYALYTGRSHSFDWRWVAGILGALLLLTVGVGLGRLFSVPPPAPVSRETSDLPTENLATDLGYDVPPSRGAGALSVQTNLPARVYIDGALVKQLAPVDQYPVRLGVHHVVVEALATQERRERMVTIQRGKVQELQETFGGSP